MLQKIWHFIKFIFSKGWVKALFIALPVTLCYGYLCVLGLSIILLHHPLSMIEYVIFFLALSGSVGLAGGWLAFLFQDRLAKKVTLLNKVTFTLLLCGVCSAIGTAIFFGVIFFSENITLSIVKEFTLYTAPLIALAFYGFHLAFKIMQKKASDFLPFL